MKTTTLLAAALLVASRAAAQPGLADDPPPLAFPVSIDTYRFTAAFDLDRTASDRADWTGWRQGDVTAGSGHAYDDHSGTDIGIATGTSLFAAAAGTVTAKYEDFPTDDHSGGGNYMIFSHPDGADTYRVNFWHLDYQGALKDVGNSVAKGELVALSDNTGNSTGPHLHCGISKQNATNSYTCGFYHGWWENDEFYYGDGYPCLQFLRVNDGTVTLNVREGASTSYPIVATVTAGDLLVASQRNGWWRVFLPMPAATLITAAGGGHVEAGTWWPDLDYASVPFAAYDGDPNANFPVAWTSRYSEFTGTGGSDTFQFPPIQVPQSGQYALFAAFPEGANAADVTYRVSHSGGTTDVLVDQGRVAVPSGTGTHASPYVVDANPYVASHTTVGGDDTWNSYSPVGTGINEAGPERVYRVDVTQAQDITVSVDHAGYPGLDVDVHLLGSLSNTNCLARNDWSFTYALPSAGTYYVVVDSWGTTNATATAYDLRIELSAEPFPNSWVPLGTYVLDRSATYNVQILESSVTGRVDPSRPGRVYADAIKVQPVLTRRTGWVSDSFVTVVNTTTTPTCTVVISADATDGDDSNDFDDVAEFPVYTFQFAAPAPTVPVAKVATGQRFVCTGRSHDGLWYAINIPGIDGNLEGWIGGSSLRIFNRDAAPIVLIHSGEQNWKQF